MRSPVLCVEEADEQLMAFTEPTLLALENEKPKFPVGLCSNLMLLSTVNEKDTLNKLQNVIH